MKINVDITKRLDWLEKRIDVSYVEREYIELQMKELAREVVKNLTIPVVVGQSEQLINFLITVREQATSSKVFEEAGDLLKQIEKIK